MSSEAELNKLKVADLTELLKEKGLPTKGNKADLVAVPYPALLSQAPRCFPPSASWIVGREVPARAGDQRCSCGTVCILVFWMKGAGLESPVCESFR